MPNTQVLQSDNRKKTTQLKAAISYSFCKTLYRFLYSNLALIELSCLFYHVKCDIIRENSKFTIDTLCMILSELAFILTRDCFKVLVLRRRSAPEESVEENSVEEQAWISITMAGSLFLFGNDEILVHCSFFHAPK